MSAGGRQERHQATPGSPSCGVRHAHPTSAEPQQQQILGAARRCASVRGPGGPCSPPPRTRL
eukprot:14771457-Alexandrium_andersonii.AAC.1